LETGWDLFAPLLLVDDISLCVGEGFCLASQYDPMESCLFGILMAKKPTHEIAIMSFREADPDIGAFLIGINLGQYLLNFRDFGYHTLQECMGINDSVLQHIGISPTGHRRRILKHLEATFTKMPETSTSSQSCSPKHLLDPKQKEAGGGISGGHTNEACISNRERNPHNTTHVLLGNRASPVLDVDSLDMFGPNLLADPTTVPQKSLKNVTSEKKPFMDDDYLKKGEPESLDVQLNATPKDGFLSSAFSPAEKKTSEMEHPRLSGLGSLLDNPQETPFFEFKGEMVENDLYCTQSPSRVGARPTRSFMLRHRPVPEIPGVSSEATSNSSLHERRSTNGLSIHCSENCVSENRELAEEKPPPISPYGETFLMNSPEDVALYVDSVGTAETYSKEPSDVLEEDKEKKRMPSRKGNQHQKNSENVKDSELTSQGDQSPLPNRFVGEAESSLLKDCSRYAWRGKYKPTKGLGEFKSGSLDLEVREQMFSSPAVCGDELVPGSKDTITPYACFYAPAAKKDIYSKGIILLSAIATVRMHRDNKFEVVTAHRIFVFRAEKEEERNNWVTMLFTALRSLPAISQARTAVPPEKSGYLELKGYKTKIFTLLQGNSVWICKNNQDFKSGYGITIIPLNVANVRQIDRTAKQCFEIITPYRSFSESNRICADCKAPDPDWASINLCVIICKKCAGQHRSLGPRDSKVRSLKMDASVWTNELIELFIVIGNERSNSFWEGNLQLDEKLQVDAPDDKRLTFITQKYKEGKFRKITLLSKTKDELNKALCAAVIKPDVLETMMLLFSGADVMCATGDPIFPTVMAAPTPLPLPIPPYRPSFMIIYTWFPSTLPSCLCNKRWCVLESGFLSYYENEKMATPSGTLDIGEVICLVIHKSDNTLPMGAMFTFEIYLLSERAFLFGAETAHSQRKWTQAIAKHFVPELARGLQERETDVIGQLFYKDCQDLDNWKKGWFALEKTSLYFCLELENSQENSMYLRRLQELTISSCIQNGEKTDVLLLVEKGRTLYIRGHTKLDFTAWHRAIEKAARTNGNLLEDQQLSRNDVPIIVNSCIAFVTQYGLGSKHIYLKNGDPSYVRELLECFKKDARSVKLRAGTNRLEDVTDTLKSFLCEIDDALLTKELYPFWISALDTLDDKDRKCSEINLMEPHNLAMAFSSCLFQTKGQTSEEVDVVEDLIVNYVQLFDISQAGDLLIDVYVERKEPDSSIIIRISPTMEAEELTRDVLGIKNLTPHKDDTWATFEVIENGELERPLHCTENILEQILHWKETSKGPVKAGYLKYKEEPSKLLSANKFQDRYFVLREGKLWLYKDMKVQTFFNLPPVPPLLFT
ncbi:Arf-GAP with Rho-GAP domain, ANK repeat and PH domain-containing protein 2, partial [Ophiophagus hannah]